MSGVNRITAERNQRILLELVSQPGNDVCADCKARTPRWASYNLGIFVCMNCASIHRKIGTHITKVKSLTLDSWTKEQVEHMKQVGNVKSNAIYNPDERRHPTPANLIDSERDSELEKFIRAKYEFKAYMAGTGLSSISGDSSSSISSGPSVLGSSRSIDRSAAVAALLGPSRSASTRLARRDTVPASRSPASSTAVHPPLPPRPTQPTAAPSHSAPPAAPSVRFAAAVPTAPPRPATQPAMAAYQQAPQALTQSFAVGTTPTINTSRTIDATLPLQVLAQPVTQPVAAPMNTSSPFTTTNPYSSLSANPMNPFPSVTNQTTGISPSGIGRSMSLNSGLSGNLGTGYSPFQTSPLNPSTPLSNNPSPNPFAPQVLPSASSVGAMGGVGAVGLGISPAYTRVSPQVQTPFAAPASSPFMAQQPMQPTQLFSPQPQVQVSTAANPYMQSATPGTPFTAPQFGGTPSPFGAVQPLAQTQSMQQPMQPFQQAPQQGFGGANPFTSWIQQQPGQQGYPWNGTM